MITKEEAVIIAENYLKKNQLDYIYLEKENVMYDKSKQIPYGKYKGENKSVYSVGYDTGTSYNPIACFLIIDVNIEEVIYIMTPHGYLPV